MYAWKFENWSETYNFMTLNIKPLPKPLPDRKGLTCVWFDFMCIVSFPTCVSPPLHPHAHSEVLVNICNASFCDTTADDVY